MLEYEAVDISGILDSHLADQDAARSDLAAAADSDRTAATSDMGIAMNVAWAGAGTGDSDTLIFVDQIKTARPWFSAWGTQLDGYDENGYLTALPSGEVLVSTLVNRSDALDGLTPYTGTMRLYGEGIGKFLIQTGGETVFYGKTAKLDTETVNGVEYWYLDIDYSSADDNGGIRMKIIEMSGEHGDYIRNLSLVHESHLDEFAAGETFAPEFVDDMSGYDTLRFMNWMGAIKYDEGDAESRYVGTDTFTFNTLAGSESLDNVFTSSAPIEYVVELANLTGANAWISLPVDITDGRAAKIATYVTRTLDSDLTVYWEYGNELWNNIKGFEGYDYAEVHGAELFGLSGISAVVEGAAYRGPQLFDLIEDVFEADADGAGSRYVAGLWSADVAGFGSWVNPDSYSRAYFAAEKAQLLKDAPSAPIDIITDYAIGAYVGLDKGRAVTAHIEQTYADPADQAEAMARWITFGSDPATSVTVTADNLDTPLTGVTYTEGMSITVAELVWHDQSLGLDSLGGLDRVLRIQGTEMQYRALDAADWSTVLVFDRAPGATIDEMENNVELVGFGQWAYGGIMPGLLTSIVNQSRIRIDGHQSYVEELGIDWIAYEGAVYTPQGNSKAYEIFREEGLAAAVTERWLDVWAKAGLDSFTYFMSHARFENDNFAVSDYSGEPLSEAPVAAYLKDRAAAANDAANVADTDADTPNRNLFDTEAGFSATDWTGYGGDWSFVDGTAMTAGPTSDSLKLTPIQVDVGTVYTLSFTVSSDMPDPGPLMITVRTFGGGSTTLLNWSDDVSDGETLKFTLPPAANPNLTIQILRRPGQAGSLNLSDPILQPLS